MSIGPRPVAVPSGLRFGCEPITDRALDHRRVVPIGGQDPGRAACMGVADHVEQGSRHRLAVDGPARVEDLVPAVLGVGLREHHQLDVVGVAAEAPERGGEVVDLVAVEGETEGPVSLLQRASASAEQVDFAQRLRPGPLEEATDVVSAREHALGHSIVQQRCHVFA